MVEVGDQVLVVNRVVNLVVEYGNCFLGNGSLLTLFASTEDSDVICLVVINTIVF